MDTADAGASAQRNTRCYSRLRGHLPTRNVQIAGRGCIRLFVSSPKRHTASVMRRILIVEDQELVRDALRILLSDTIGVEVVGVASSIQDARRQLVDLRPDVALVDLMLDDGVATDLVGFVRSERLKTRLIVLTGVPDTFAAIEALAAGANGYLLKLQSVTDLLEAIETVSCGRQYVSPVIAARMNNDAPTTETRGLSGLSRRETEILRMLARGSTSREIGARLSISAKTVDTHRTNINRKLGLRNTVDVLRFAVASGFGILETSTPPPRPATGSFRDS